MLLIILQQQIKYNWQARILQYAINDCLIISWYGQKQMEGDSVIKLAAKVGSSP
jgi:hypothetical protein